MILIAILLCLALQRIINISWVDVLWFRYYLNFLNPWLVKLNPWLAIGVIILPVLIILFSLHLLLIPCLFGLCNLIFSTMILFVCIDTRDFKNQLNAYFVDLKK